MVLDPSAVTYDQLTEQEKAYAAKVYPGIKVPGMPKSKTYKKAASKSKSATPGKLKQVVSRPWYHIISWCVVAVCAYVYLGVGWTLRVVGEALLRGGQWLHEYKWRLGK